VRPSLWYAPILLLGLIVACYYTTPHLTNKYDWFTYLFCLSFAIFLVGTFAMVPKSSFDALIGNLAYPLFLVHVPMIEVLKACQLTAHNPYAASFIVSIGAAIIMYYAIEWRSEVYRRGNRKASSSGFAVSGFQLRYPQRYLAPQAKRSSRIDTAPIRSLQD
jgi:peptidoglycan/LPS O-acetylase OafA/YrhL